MRNSIITTHYADAAELLDHVTQDMADLISYCRQHPGRTTEQADAYADIANRLVDLVSPTDPDPASKGEAA